MKQDSDTETKTQSYTSNVYACVKNSTEQVHKYTNETTIIALNPVNALKWEYLVCICLAECRFCSAPTFTQKKPHTRSSPNRNTTEYVLNQQIIAS